MAPPTNVLLITADQWRGDCLGAAGHPVVRTPNLDRLAADGVSFRRHYAQAAPCGPSRAALYTGMYLMNHRSVGNGTPLDARHDNVALVARRAGYEPALFGYTDTSIDPRTRAPDDPRLFEYEGVLPGFDPVCHLPESKPYPWLDWMRADGVDVPEQWRPFADEPAPGSRWRTQYEAKHSQTAFLTGRFLEWAAARPPTSGGWFAHISYLRPHPPFLAPAPYDTMYDPSSVPAPVRAASRAAEGEQHPLLAVMIDHPFLKSPDDEQEQRELQATYYGMIAEVDDQVARILDWLDDTGQADRTLVIFTSDHGENLGDHFLLHKLGWFDQSYNVPLIMRGPGAGALGTVDAYTEHVDVLPTVCELLGVDVPLQCDGRALTPWLRGRDAGDWRRETHFEFDFRDPDSPLIEEVFGITLEECALAVLRDDHGKLVQFSGYPALPSIFFDLDADPAQITNVAADPAYAPKVLDYAQRMLAWRMRHAERTLTGMKLTMHAGLVERTAPLMDARTFFGLEPVSADGTRWRMEIVRSLTSGTGALFGGCGLGACIDVMEHVTGRPCVWATAEYLSFARPPSVLELDVLEVVRGHQISQARVIARVGDLEILTVLGALGYRTLDLEGQWAVRPVVPPPEDCPPRPLLNHHEGRISSRLDAKLANGRAPWDLPGPPGSGHAALWIRMPEVLEMSAAALAIVGDFVPFGIGQALGRRAGGNSLDNTLRIAHRVPTTWVLADVRVHAVADGFGHGLVHLWAEDGTLLGTASQSAIVRAWRDEQTQALTELEGDVQR